MNAPASPAIKKLLPSIQLALFMIGGFSHALAQTNNYYGTSGAFSGSVWSTNPAGPYTSSLAAVGGAIINFGNNATQAGGANSITVARINSTANFSLTGSPTGTISNLGNGIVAIDVASGKTLDFGSQAFTSSGTAGYIKTGTGTLALAGGTYGGGFTLNAGTVVLRGVNGMGGGATNSLTINGGTLAANANRDLTGKFANGITVGGDFQLGALSSAVSISSNTANLTFSNNLNLGGSTRTITLGANGTYTLGGTLANGGLTVAGASGATGKLALSGSNTYAGGTTIDGGTVSLGNDSALGTGSVTVNSGGTLAIGSHTIANPIVLGSGTLAAGGGALSGTLSGSGTLTGPLTLNAGAIYSWNLASASTSAGQFSQLTLNGGSLNLTGALLQFANGGTTPTNTAFWQSNQSWTVVTATSGSITGTFSLGSLDQSSWNSLGSFSMNGTNLDWTAATAIPEPSTHAALLGAAALAGVVIVRRRKLRQAAAGASA